MEQMLMFEASQIASVAEACAADTLERVMFDLAPVLATVVVLKIDRHTAKVAAQAMPSTETTFLVFMFDLFKVKK